MQVSPVKDEIMRRHLGVPEDAGPVGILVWDALDEIADGLGLDGDRRLADIACGRGGYGIELALRYDAELVGVDFSAVALEQARRTAQRRLVPGQAEFKVGTMTDTGLATGSVDAVLCTDSVQFAEPLPAALKEFRRILHRGGGLVLTTWQAMTPGDERVPARLRRLDLERDLGQAGFDKVVVEVRPHWRAVERRLHEEAVATPNDGSDLALASLQGESASSLEEFDLIQRVVAYATVP
jgi:SAM-dependent methyltransferase